MENKELTSYTQVPWFRKWWFVLISILFFPPVALYLLHKGNAYYADKKDSGKIKKLGRPIYYTAWLFCIFWTISFVLGGNDVSSESSISTHSSNKVDNDINSLHDLNNDALHVASYYGNIIRPYNSELSVEHLKKDIADKSKNIYSICGKIIDIKTWTGAGYRTVLEIETNKGKREVHFENNEDQIDNKITSDGLTYAVPCETGSVLKFYAYPLDNAGYSYNFIKYHEDMESHVVEATKKYFSDIVTKGGVIQNLNDAIVKLNASADSSYTKSPPLGSSSKDEFYAWTCNLKLREDDNYLCWYEHDKAGFIFNGIIKNFTSLQANKRYTVVGRYSDTFQLNLNDGQKIPIAVLTDTYVFD